MKAIIFSAVSRFASPRLTIPILAIALALGAWNYLQGVRSDLADARADAEQAHDRAEAFERSAERLAQQAARIQRQREEVEREARERLEALSRERDDKCLDAEIPPSLLEE